MMNSVEMLNNDRIKVAVIADQACLVIGIHGGKLDHLAIACQGRVALPPSLNLQEEGASRTRVIPYTPPYLPRPLPSPSELWFESDKFGPFTRSRTSSCDVCSDKLKTSPIFAVRLLCGQNGSG